MPGQADKADKAKAEDMQSRKREAEIAGDIKSKKKKKKDEKKYTKYKIK